MQMIRMAWMSSMSCVLISSATLFSSQTPSTSVSAPAFEVASVRENRSSDTQTFSSPGLMPTPWRKAAPRPGAVTIRNIALRDLIGVAYGIDLTLYSQLVTGGPAGLLGTRFDIDARPPEGALASETLPMLRTLLADRFKLRVHIERRDRPVYALVLARQGQLGRGLRPSDVDCTAPGAPKDAIPSATSTDINQRLVCRANVYDFGKPGPGDITISDRCPLPLMIARLQPFVDRPLIDATGLSGSFEWSVSFATRGDSTSAPIIYTALQEQLGIKAERRTAPFDVVVIDSAEMPMPN
ncbi:MAG TPA: TIGR03435 family protein [Vicinamibacterales bacterium]|nr:TIGR03435 family protein [Vicinamibacterales bacterium]